MSSFFSLLDIHLKISWQLLLPTLLPSLSFARQRKLIWPHESPVQPCSPPLPLPSRCLSCCVRPWFDLSRRCQQPLINVQKQPYCYVHRSSQRNAEDSSESRWLFLASLNEHQVEISRILRPFAMISKEISIWEIPQMEYIFARIIICKN